MSIGDWLVAQSRFDSLGLNADNDSYFTKEGSNFEATTTSQATNEPNTSSMEYNAIPLYLKMMSSMALENNQENMNINPNIQGNTNNNADSKPEEGKEDSTPTLQVNTQSSTGNLSRKVFI